MEFYALWGFWFRNQKSAISRAHHELYVRSNAVVPEGIPSEIQQGLDAGAKELLSQAALARQQWTDALNPKVMAIREYLTSHDMMVKPTDKNLGLSGFPRTVYNTALENHLASGPYAPFTSPFPSALEFHRDILRRLPKAGLNKMELKFIREHRVIAWPQFHMIPKVHKNPWAWRPIVPAHSSPMTRLSKVADIALSALLPRFPHLIRSTAEWIRAFNAGLVKSSGFAERWLITGDIVAFYTNVDTDTIHRSMEALLRGSRVPA